jgi:hypothetical protein
MRRIWREQQIVFAKQQRVVAEQQAAIARQTNQLDVAARVWREQQSAIAANENAAAALRGELDAVYGSTSWRITKPVRWLKRTLSHRIG